MWARRAVALVIALTWTPLIIGHAVRVSHSRFSVSLHHCGRDVEQNLVRKHLQEVQNHRLHFQRMRSVFATMSRSRVEATTAALLPLSVQVLPKKRISTYYGHVVIGMNPSTTFRVMFDTGSSEIWVPDDMCLAPECMRHTQYKGSGSLQKPVFTSTGQSQSIDVEYLSGGFHGYQGQETVTLQPGLRVVNQTVDFATTMTIPLLNDIQWDGIVGLGFRNTEQLSRGTWPVIETMKRQGSLAARGLRNQFAYYVSARAGKGSLTFGGVDLTLKRSPKDGFQWARAEQGTPYWMTTVQSAFWDPHQSPTREIFNTTGRDLSSGPSKRTAIIDTGTYLIYVPKGDPIAHDLAALDTTLRQSSSCTEAKSHLPYLHLSLQGLRSVGPDLVLAPEHYVIDYGQGSDCYLGLVEDDERQDTDPLEPLTWTLGQIFLQGYYTVFDSDIPAVGFTTPKA